MSHFSYDSNASNKNDNDPIMDFFHIPTQHLETKKFNLRKIPFYEASNNEFIALTLQKIETIRNNQKKNPLQHVLPIDPYRMMWINKKKKFKDIPQKSFINLPSASGISWMSKRVKNRKLEKMNTISYVMNLIRLAEAKEYTIFLLGGKDNVLEKLFFNLKRSFPDLRIVGRQNGYGKKESRDKIVEALKKTNPHIILLGLGFHKEMIWLEEYRDQLKNTILVNVGGALETLSGQNKKAPDFVVNRKLTWLYRALNRPYRWHRMLFIIQWYLSSLFKRDVK